jgi:hypothetical protein
MARIIIYYCTKVTLKGIVKRDIVLLRKGTRKPKGIALTLLAKRKPYATRTLQKAAQKLKIKSSGIFFPESCIYGCMGRFPKIFIGASWGSTRIILKTIREVYDG